MPTSARFLGPYERLILLKAISLAGQPPAAALGALATHAIERHFDAGARLADPDRPWESVHVVVDGRVAVREDGRSVYSVTSGRSLGMLETLARVQAGIEALAEVDTVTLEIRASTLLSILEDHHGMARETIQALARLLLTDPSCSCLPGTWDRRQHLPAMPARELDLVDRIRLLQTSGAFSHARVDSLAELAAQHEEFRAQPGTVLWQEGDPGGWFFLVLDGTIESESDAQNRLHFSWTRGMAPGLFEALGGVPRWHSAIAATPVRGLRLMAERLFDALEDDFAMAADLLSAMAGRVRYQCRVPGTPRLGPGTPSSAPSRS
jgi:CRP-like cAMP-binding protein